MSDMDKATVRALREAAAREDWAACDTAGARALSALPFDVQLELVEDLLWDGLRRFEVFHPGQTWARRAIEGETIEPSPGNAGPGGNAFCAGVDRLVDARTRLRDDERRRGAIQRAFVCAVVAEVAGFFSEFDRDGWQRWYDESGPRAMGETRAGWAGHPRIREVERRQWLEVADKLEALMNEIEAGVRDMSPAEALRHAAAERDWNACAAAIVRALARLDGAAQIGLAEAMLRRGLPRFEHNHPGETWPRRALDGETDELGPDYPGPGGNSFASGVEDLLDARADTDKPRARRVAAGAALGRAVMAELSATWGELHPERWRRSREVERSGESDYTIMAGWEKHPRVRDVELAMWNEIADRLDALLADANASAGGPERGAP